MDQSVQFGAALVVGVVLAVAFMVFALPKLKEKFAKVKAKADAVIEVVKQ